MDITADGRDRYRTLQHMDFSADGRDRYRTLQHMDITADDRDRYRTLQHMNITADDRDRYRTLQHMDFSADGRGHCRTSRYMDFTANDVTATEHYNQLTLPPLNMTTSALQHLFLVWSRRYKIILLMQKRFLLDSKSVVNIRRNIKMLICSCNSILDISNLSLIGKNFE